MRLFLQRALKDILDNRFLTVITVVTIALSILIASAFALFFLNAGDVLNVWQNGIRMVVYLKPGTSEAGRLDTKFRLQGIAGVQEAEFVSKSDALARLKKQMANQSALLEGLKENPLPDSFEITLQSNARNSDELQFLAERIRSLSTVDDVEYGQQWIQRFSNLINLFSLAGYAIGVLFFMATVFIVANTIRLVLYSRRDEIEVMRLVGATDRFIKIPFYLEGMIQGGIGTILGLLALYAGYAALTAHFEQNIASAFLTVRFFPLEWSLLIIIGGILVGWIGCLVSLKQFMKI